jgi:spore germination protein YaaH
VAVYVGGVARGGGDEAPDTRSIHRLELEAHRDVPTTPSLIGKGGAPTVPLRSRGTQSRPCATVFGYLPYWSDADYLRYDLLSHLACFSVEVNPDGSLGNDHGWPWTSVINEAHANGVKVILVATLFNSDHILTLITNPTYKNRFFSSIKAKMLEGDADGLNIDFEGSGSAWKAYINGFMADLTAYLHTELPGSEVTFAGPAVNWSSVWDLPGLAASCDGIFIMGYAFAGQWSSTSAPNSPLIGGSINITNTVLVQYGDVTRDHPEKLILGLPYYGNHWTTVSSSARSTATDWLGSTRFFDDQPDSLLYGLLWEAQSQTPWYRWQEGSTWHQVWFDNAESLGLKYDLALENELQGVGMWALGYDGARPELWDQLEQQFGGCFTCCDLDEDGDVDFDDFASFQFCMQGPDAIYDPTHFCAGGDADEDDDVDLHDFAVLQQSFGN